jgi:hypothetical protein
MNGWMDDESLSHKLSTFYYCGLIGSAAVLFITLTISYKHELQHSGDSFDCQRLTAFFDDGSSQAHF